jgi:selenocysteine lyase/cysteine desulfurase
MDEAVARRLASRVAAFEELERSVEAALEHYSSVHRGTGHSSVISTELFERARSIILRHLGLEERDHVVVFCSPRQADAFRSSLRPGSRATVVDSADLGLPLGVCAVAAPRVALPRGVPFETGGGTIKMVSPGRIAWADAPARFEPGTPNIVGVIALGAALNIAARRGANCFRSGRSVPLPPEAVFADRLDDLSGSALLDRLRERPFGLRARVPVDSGELDYVNFDSAASTPTFRPVWEAFCRALRQPEEAWPGIIAAARARCLDFFGAPAADYDLLFTGNTTEAVNVAARCLVAPDGADTVVLNTMLEHNSNELPWRHCPAVTLVRLPVDAEGFIDLLALERLLREYNVAVRHGARRVRLVAVCGASNVMGSYNDIPAISRIVHRHGARLLVDAAQLAAHRPVRMAADDIDLLAFSAHKMYAPFGSGGLLVRRDLRAGADLSLLSARHSGEQNVAGIAALGKTAELLGRIGFDVILEEERRLTTRALEGLGRNPAVRVWGITGPDAERFPGKGGVVCFSVRGVPHNLAARRLAELGAIGVRHGCFCVNMYVKRLLGIGRVKDALAHAGLALFPSLMEPFLIGLVRVSFGIENTEAEVDRLLATLDELSREPSSRVNRLLARMHFGTPFEPAGGTKGRIAELAADVARRVYGPTAD